MAKGRKSKYTPEVVERIVQAVRVGATYELAAQYGGIAKSTFYEWMADKVDFSDAVKAAEGQAAVKWLAVIDKAANGTDERAPQWQAAAWKLERRYPHEYGRQVQEITGKDGEPLTVQIIEVIR